MDEKNEGATSSTLFVFVSPQFLAGNKAFLDAIIACARWRTLRSVVVDEAHLLAIHGASFWIEVRKLRDVFWQQVFLGGFTPPYALVLTGTMSRDNLHTFSDLTTLAFPSKSRVWDTAEGFAQSYLHMEHVVSSQYTTNLDAMIDFLQEETSDMVFLFANSSGLRD